MNGYVVADAVIDRLRSDSSLYTAGNWTSIVSGGVSTVRANAQSLSLPHATVEVSWNANHALGAMYGQCTILITYFYTHSMQNGGRAWTDRVIGDAMLASGTNYTPTYGLHNHVLSLPSIGTDNVLGMTCDQLNYDSFEMSGGDTVDSRQVVMQFSCRVYKKAVTA